MIYRLWSLDPNLEYLMLCDSLLFFPLANHHKPKILKLSYLNNNNNWMNCCSLLVVISSLHKCIILVWWLIALITFILNAKWLFMELIQCNDYCCYHICMTLFVRPISFYQYNWVWYSNPLKISVQSFHKPDSQEVI